MTDNNLVNRIPHEDIKTFKSWHMPSVTGKKVNQKKDIPKKHKESIEEVRPEDLRAVTADQLQKVAEEAEREGREKGYEEGLNQGFSEGEKQGLKNGEAKAYNETKKHLEEQIAFFSRMSEALFEPVNMQDSELENTIIDMVVNFTKHLIGRELTQDPSTLFKLVEQVVGALPIGQKNIRVYLHADDIELVKEAFEGEERGWGFIADSGLSRGGCRVETDQSLVDYSVEHRVKQMLERIDFQGDMDGEEAYKPKDYQQNEVEISVPPPETSEKEGSTISGEASVKELEKNVLGVNRDENS